MSSSHFDRIASDYDDSLPPQVVAHYLRKRAEFIVEHCPAGTALDVGCGTGVLAARVAQLGFDVVGLDPSEEMLERLRARASDVRTVMGSGDALPFADDTFDLVLSVAVMHHIAAGPDVRRTLSEMVRVTKPSGRVLVWDHNPRNPYWGRLMARVPQDRGDERLIDEAELVAGLRDAGAEILVATQLGMVPDFTPRAAMAAAAAAEWAFERTPLVRRLCAHNVILATKPDPRR